MAAATTYYTGDIDGARFGGGGGLRLIASFRGIRSAAVTGDITINSYMKINQ